MVARRNLVIVHTPGVSALSDWLTVKATIAARAPDIKVHVVSNLKRNYFMRYWPFLRPSLVFCLGPLERYKPKGGKLYAGHRIPKDEEMRQLGDAGLPIPDTLLLTPDVQLPPEWGEYVAVKPVWGIFGGGIRLLPAAEVRSSYAALTDNGRAPHIVQPYIDNNEPDRHNVSYRVLTLFGRELYASVKYWAGPRPPLGQLAKEPAGIIGSKEAIPAERALFYDEEIISLARSVSAAFPTSPVLGVDVVRDCRTGRLYIMECHPSGRIWHLSSDIIREYPEPWQRSLNEQFDALDRTADLLIERTRVEAR